MAQASLGCFSFTGWSRLIGFDFRLAVCVAGFAVALTPLRLLAQDSVREESTNAASGPAAAISAEPQNNLESALESLLKKIRSTSPGESSTGSSTDAVSTGVAPPGTATPEGADGVGRKPEDSELSASELSASELSASELSASELSDVGLPSRERLAELVEIAFQPNPKGRRRFFLRDRTSGSDLRAEKLRDWFEETGLLADLKHVIALRDETIGFDADIENWMFGVASTVAGQGAPNGGSQINRSNRNGDGKGGSRFPSGVIAKRASQAYTLLGWNPGTYAIAQSEHFEVLSQAGEKSTVEVALACESIQKVWRQVFEVEESKQGQATEIALERVVLFRTREAYVRALRTLEPRIGISTGYYSPTHKTVFFYWEGSKSLATLVHEVTHQLFDRESGYGFDADESAGYWVIEALALYMESWSEESLGGLKIIDIGGWDSPRLQAARFRRLRDQYWIPWDEFSAADGKRMRSEPDVAAWYSQACGLAHCAMDQSPEVRSAFLSYVKSVYGNEGKTANTVFDTNDGLLKKYDTYLLLSHNNESPRLSFSRRNEVVLTRCEVSSDDLLRWPTFARKLQWLDLGFTQVSDSIFLSETERPWDVVRLNLELTNVSDASMPAIAAMPSLAELDLTQTKITDEGIASLAKHPSLRKLWIGGTQVSDRSVAILSTIPKLDQLQYEDSAMTQQGFSTLVRLKPSLRKKK